MRNSMGSTLRNKAIKQINNNTVNNICIYIYTNIYIYRERERDRERKREREMHDPNM